MEFHTNIGATTYFCTLFLPQFVYLHICVVKQHLICLLLSFCLPLPSPLIHACPLSGPSSKKTHGRTGPPVRLVLLQIPSEVPAQCRGRPLLSVPRPSSFHPEPSNYRHLPMTTRAQLLANALVRRRVLRHVPRPTIGRDLAPPALDSLRALGEVAPPSQLAAKPQVRGQVLCRVVLAAVESDSTPRTLVKGNIVLRRHLAQRVLALSDCPLKVLRVFADFGVEFLSNE